MRLDLDPNLGAGYTSPPQRIRRITEAWFQENMYCPACPSPGLARARGSEPVVDFNCGACGAEYQVKAKGGAWPAKFRDAAYGPMMERAQANCSPHFAFIGYDPQYWRVNRLLLVPGHFVTPDVIEQCRPLSARARRAGWTACNVLLQGIPPDGRVGAVCESTVVPQEAVRARWAQFVWLRSALPEERGWTVDVLRCVRSFGAREFTLAEMYAFEKHLAAAHPENRNVRAKIRQQLQVLRDKGVLQFLARGRYAAL